MLKKIRSFYNRISIPFRVQKELRFKLEEYEDQIDLINSKKEEDFNSLNKKIEESELEFIDFYGQSDKNEAEIKSEEQEENKKIQFPKKKYEAKILDFANNPSLINSFYVIGDMDIGGLSEGQAEYSENMQALRVLGMINTERKQKMMKTPFFLVGISFIKSINLRNANAFRIVMKNQSKSKITMIFRSNSQAEEGYSNNIGYIYNEDPNWISIDLPFENFIVEKYDLKRDMFLDPYYNDLRVSSIDFYCESDQEIGFDFYIRSISAIYDEDIVNINKIVKKKPYFIRSLNDYGDIQQRDIQFGMKYLGVDN